jgi:hypothetical protein
MQGNHIGCLRFLYVLAHRRSTDMKLIPLIINKDIKLYHIKDGLGIY